MELSRVDEQLRGSVKQPVNFPINRWWGRALTRWLVRFAPSVDTNAVTITDVRIGSSGKRSPGVRIHRPDIVKTNAALLWIHGGGMLIGRASMDDRLCASTARELGIVVVSVDYRLAPDVHFPVPLDDCRAAWDWLQQNAQSLGIDATRVVIGGQSAGGGLAAGLVQRLVDSPAPHPLAQWLFCPMLDDRTAADRGLDAIDNWVWNNAINRFGWRSYLGVEPGAPDLPAYASPARRIDFNGFPPTWVGVGDIDLFYAEDLGYADRLAAAGAPVTTDVVAGAPHGFEAWAPDAQISRDYVARAQAWLKSICS